MSIIHLFVFSSLFPLTNFLLNNIKLTNSYNNNKTSIASYIKEVLMNRGRYIFYANFFVMEFYFYYKIIVDIIFLDKNLPSLSEYENYKIKAYILYKNIL